MIHPVALRTSIHLLVNAMDIVAKQNQLLSYNESKGIPHLIIMSIVAVNISTTIEYVFFYFFKCES